MRARDESRDGFGEPPTENGVVVRDDAFAATADASALARHRNSPPATRFVAHLANSSRSSSPERSRRTRLRRASPTAFDFEPATLRSPDGAEALVVAAAAIRIRNPKGSTRDSATSSRPALVALLR